MAAAPWGHRGDTERVRERQRPPCREITALVSSGGCVHRLGATSPHRACAGGSHAIAPASRPPTVLASGRWSLHPTVWEPVIHSTNRRIGEIQRRRGGPPHEGASQL